MAEENIGEMYLEIKTDATKLRTELEALKSEVSRKAPDIEKHLSFKARFDTGIAKLKLSELQKYRKKLELEFAKKISLNVDAGSLDRTRQKIASVDAQLNGVGKTSVSMGSKLAAGFVALGVVTQAFNVLRNSVKAYIESAKAMAGVEQAVKRTGMAAGYTAEQLGNMAAELQKITGVDDDEILKGVTKQLLTFTQITGTAFERAQVAVLDLNSVIADGNVAGLSSQAIQLGKALENPIAGVGALSRAGVTFTAEQKKMIKGFIEQNDLLSAQGIILTEIENKYGGQAEALAKAQLGAKQFGAAFGDLQEGIGEFLTNAPGLMWLIENMTKGFANWSKLFQGNAYYLKQLRVELQNLRNDAAQITFDSLVSSTEEMRSGLKKHNEEQLAANKQQWDELQKQIVLEQGSLRLNNDKIIALQQQQVIINKSSAIIRGELDALTKYEKKIKDGNVAWTEEGKTIDQIGDRITELTTLRGSFDPIIDKKEIADIDSKIEKLQKRISKPVEGSIGFVSSIPKGYTAATVAEFETLRYAVVGYVKFRQEQIELAYSTELKKAKGNKDAILKAEEEKQLALARLNQESTQFNKEQLERQAIDTENYLKEMELTNKESQNKVLKQEFDYQQDKKKAMEQYYGSLQNISEDYFQYQIQKIQEEAEQLALITGDPVKAKQQEYEALKMLEEEYFQWRMDKWIEAQGVLGQVAVAGFEGMSAAYDTLWQTLTDASMSGTERVTAVFNSMKQTAITVLGDIVKNYIASWIKSAVIGDSFKALELSKGIALGTALAQAYAPAAAFASTMSFGGAAVAGAAGLTSTVALANTLAIPKFASGTDGYQRVPDGFSNDNYPIMMKSGEDFKVRTPAQQNKEEIRMAGIEKRLDILNANLVDKEFSPTLMNAIYMDGKKMAESVVRALNILEREGKKLGGF